MLFFFWNAPKKKTKNSQKQGLEKKIIEKMIKKLFYRMACILSALLEEHGKKKTDKGQSAKQQPRRQLWCARRRKYEGAREGQIQTVESSFSSIKNNSVVKVCNKMQRIECGICGGVGKSRFDGIVCCDDCKGFFRRRVTMGSFHGAYARAHVGLVDLGYYLPKTIARFLTQDFVPKVFQEPWAASRKR